MKSKISIKKDIAEKWNKLSKKNKKLIVGGIVAGSVLGLCCVPFMMESNEKTYTVSVTNDSDKKEKDIPSVEDKDEKLSTSKEESETQKDENTTSVSHSQTETEQESTGTNENVQKENDKPTSSGQTSPSGSNQSSEPEHKHSWKEVTQTIHHDAVTHVEKILVSEAYDEPTYETIYKDICNDCGADITGNANGHLLATEHGSFTGGVPYSYQSGVIHHGAIYDEKVVVDQAAYDEVVVSGYTCSCGATK